MLQYPLVTEFQMEKKMQDAMETGECRDSK